MDNYSLSTAHLSVTTVSYSSLITHLFIYFLFISSFSLIHLFHIHFLFFTYSSLISYSSLIYHLFIPPLSGIVTAGRIPPCGGIARPQGKHSRHMTVFCLPAADSSARIGVRFARG
jgi:hypothetical protein